MAKGLKKVDRPSVDSDRIAKVIVVIESSTGYGRGILRGIAQYARMNGPWSINMDPWEIYNRELPRMSNWLGEGILARVSSEKVAERIMDSRLPAVYLACDSTKRLPALRKKQWDVIPSVISNSRAIGEMAARHLLDRGFRHFAFCGIPYCSWSRKRKEAFLHRIEKAGYACHLYPEPGLQKDRRWENEQTLLAEWIRSLPKPVGLMACNDERARYVIETARIMGLIIPDDLAVMGVDNDELLCDLSCPPLTSVELNVEKAGYEAAALLDRLMSGREAMQGQQILVEPIGVAMRQSTNILAISDPDVSAAIRFIREHARDTIRVADVVRETGCSSRRLLERHFQQVVGRSILREILHARIELARDLLSRTDLPISEVALHAGFSSTTHLGILFKRETRFKPTVYRKQFRHR